ncbi:MAG: hypothetical protein ABI645_02180 [Pseudomonadota bacterium]
MAPEYLTKPPRKYWVGVSLASAVVLFGIVATLGIILRPAAEIAAQLGLSPDLIFWLLLGVAIVGEVVGILGLVLRRTWATPFFGLSLILTPMFYAYVLVKGSGGSIIGPGVITMLHAALLWFSIVAGRRGWTHRGV